MRARARESEAEVREGRIDRSPPNRRSFARAAGRHAAGRPEEIVHGLQHRPQHKVLRHAPVAAAAAAAAAEALTFGDAF